MNKFDEEKAKSLWYHFCTEKSCDGYDDCKLCPKAQAHPQLIEMAQWKDEQFKEQKKLTWKEVKYIIELDGNIETDNFMGSDEYYQAIADKANVVLFGLQGKID